MKRLLAVALGILTAIGGFVDIGDLVANALVGSRFGLTLAWATLLGVVGICVFAEMSGRVAAMSGRGTFDLVRERLGARVGLMNLVASLLVTLLTVAAEIGGVALTIQLLTGVDYLLIAPVAALVVWWVLWRVRFATLENVFGLLGLALLVFIVALWQLHPHWAGLAHQVTHPQVPQGQGTAAYLYYAVALFGAAMTPYEVFFFSSGAVEERWTAADIGTARSNVFIGFPLGGLLSLAIAATATVVLLPQGIDVTSLAQVAQPVSEALGRVGLDVVLLGFFAATFGAALETALSCGYACAQYFGWQWGKYVAPRAAAPFHVVVGVSILVGVAVLLTTVDPIAVTEYSIVFSAVALPLTYFPILVVANDRDYLKDRANGRLANGLGTVVLGVVVLAAAAAIPLMIISRAGA